MAKGAKRWIIRLETGLRPDITVAVRMDEGNETILDYLLPPADITDGVLRLAEENGFGLDVFRIDTLECFFSMARRFPFQDIAA